MTRMDITPTDLTGAATQARAWLSILAGQLADAGPSGVAISSGLQALAASIEAITAAKATFAKIASDPAYAAAYKLQQAKTLVGDAYGEATRAALDLAAAIDKARTQLASSIMPSRPTGADAAMLAFTAGQVAATLEASGEGQSVVKAAAQLLADALASGDTVQAYLVAGGPMSLLYRRKDVIMGALFQEFARVIDAADAQPASGGGAALLPVISAGGSGTLRGLVDGARMAITQDQGAYQEWLQASAATGALQGVWGEPRGQALGDGRYSVR